MCLHFQKRSKLTGNFGLNLIKFPIDQIILQRNKLKANRITKKMKLFVIYSGMIKCNQKLIIMEKLVRKKKKNRKNSTML